MKRLLVPLTLALTLIIGCQQEPAEKSKQVIPEPRNGGVYRAALPWSPRNLDPAFSTDIYSVTIIQQIFDGLVQFDQNLNVVPALASDWRVSSDGLVYTFTIRGDAKFHNGRQVTANDFVYSFTRILDPKEESSALTFFKRVEGADAYRSGKSGEVAGLKALGANTLEIKLTQPYAPFLSILAMKSSKVVPKEEVEKWGKEFSHHPMGTGPFRLEFWEGSKIILTANPFYYEGRPYLDRVVYTIYPGAQHQKVFEDFLAGRLEEAFVIGASREKMAQTKTYQYYRKPSLSLMFYGINCSAAPLSDRRVRLALNLGINKQRIINEVFKDQFIPAETILPPGMVGYTPENSAYIYDPERAKALLAEAGYGPAKDRLSLTLISASKSDVAQKELAMVRADLADVGVDLQIKYETDWPTFEASLSQPGLQLYRYAWFADIPDPDNFLNILCGSESRYNFMRYRNPQVDRLLYQALVETDIIKRVSLYREAERIILEDAPMVPIMYLTFESVFQPYVKGLEISALGMPYMPLKKIWLDKH
jgi:ABC-type transport system substrate-binding protein